jgi:hypothetical protein
MGKRSECDEARFLEDVATHEMQIIRDDGVNRHIRFKRPGTMCYHFDLITWPGHLCYTGDMGTYVFYRIEDMFEFFRMDAHDWNKNPNGLGINPGYWSEKIIATDKNGGHEEWDEEEFTRRVNEWRVRWMREAKEEGMDKDERRELWEDVEHTVLSDPNDESICVARIWEYRHTINGEDFEFIDFFDGSMNRYTFHYLWCCYALAWGINKYDDHRSKVAEQ